MRTLLIFLFVSIVIIVGITYQIRKKSRLTSTETPITLFKYTLVSIDNSSSLKTVISIEVPEKLSDFGIRSVAQRAIKDLQITTDKIHVFILLPGMTDGNGAWARVDYDPVETVTILGRSIEHDEFIELQLSQIDTGIGIWKDDKLEGDVLMRIRIDNQLGYVFEYISAQNPSQSKFPSQLQKKTINGKLVFIDIESSAKEYFVVEGDGTLSAYDSYGLIDNFPKAY